MYISNLNVNETRKYLKIIYIKRICVCKSNILLLLLLLKRSVTGYYYRQPWLAITFEVYYIVLYFTLYNSGNIPAFSFDRNNNFHCLNYCKQPHLKYFQSLTRSWCYSPRYRSIGKI